MRIVETAVYTFDELSPEAQEKALVRLRVNWLDYEWWDHIYEDAECIGLIIQGFDIDRGNYIDAVVNASWTVEAVAEAIIDQHGDQCDSYALAKDFLASEQTEKDAREFLFDLKTAYLCMLSREYNYLLSDECMIENICENGYEFTVDGVRV